MHNPTRITRLEWRKARRTQDRGWTSHSWLEAFMQDGLKVRLEFFADHGVTASVVSRTVGDPTSVLYENRSASSQDFSRPLTRESMLEIAQEITRNRPYSLSDFNCHHFVLEMWNQSVIEKLQQSHYPDRMKTGLLRGLEESLGTWLAGFAASVAADGGSAHNAFASASSTAAADPPRAQPAEPAAAAPRRATHLSGMHEEGSRVSGNVEGLERSSPNFDRDGRLRRFGEALQEGRVLMLEAGGQLKATVQPTQAPRSSISDPGECLCESWADCWLPRVGYAAIRLAERIGTTDAIELVAKVFTPASEVAGIRSQTKPGATLRGAPAKGFSPFASLSGSMPEGSALGTPYGFISDICFVVLRGQELRLAIFAILRPSGGTAGSTQLGLASTAASCRVADGGGTGEGTHTWRLRLLSGDALTGEEARFTYTLRELPLDAPGTAADAAQEEMHSMLIALATNDWGFVTLL